MRSQFFNKLADVSRPGRHQLAKLIVPHIYHNKHRQRPVIDFLCSQNKNNLVGIEVGVARAENAEKMLKKLDIKMLYLVDSYNTQIEKNSEQNRLIAFKKMKKYSQRTKFIIADSVDASFKIPEQVDFVYVDGDHSFAGVKRDIEAYYPLVKDGGIIGGHDFYGCFLGVISAVLDWTKKNNMKLYTKNFDWWIIK